MVAPMQGKRVAATQTAQRALLLLAAFKAESRALSNAELAERTGHSKSSVSRIARSLVELGYLHRAPDGARFQLGSRSRIPGRAFLAASPLPTLARPVMQEFADRFDVWVFLAAPHGADMVCLQSCNSGRAGAFRRETGAVLPMACTAAGRAWVAAQDVQARAAFLRQLTEPAAHAGALHQQLLEAIDSWEAKRYCVALAEDARESYGVASVVELGARRPGLLAIGFGGVTGPRDAHHLHGVLAPAVLACAARLRDACASLPGPLD